MTRHNLWNNNNNLQRKLVLRFELKRLVLKSFKKNRGISFIRRYLASFYLSNIPNKSSISNSIFRCTRSGRVWSVNRKTTISRFVLRSEAYKSNIPGLSRAS